MENDLIYRGTLLDEFEWLKMTVGSGSVSDIDDAIERIKKVPAVDAVEVVRCADCRAYGKSPFGHPHIGWCIIEGHHRKPDFYCKSGKRRSAEVKKHG